MKLTDDDLREIYSLFTSCTQTEREQIYNEDNMHYYKNIDLDGIYELSMANREFALDSWRAVITYLKNKGFHLFKNGGEYSLNFIDDEYIDDRHNPSIRPFA